VSNRTVDLDDLFAPEDKDRELAAKIASTFLGPEKPRKSAKTICDSVWTKLLRDVDGMIQTGDWTGASARHLVALYAACHKRVYRVDAAELGPSQRLHATGMAMRMLDREFDGKIVAMVEFIRWTWIREEGREDWRKKNNIDGGRVGWKLQFNGAILTDWRRVNVRQVAR
jgi:hypothetical protein